MQVLNEAGVWTATGDGYRWSWNPGTDVWQVEDSRGRLIAAGPLLPRFLFADGEADALTAGPAEATVDGATLTVQYRGTGEVRLRWTFFPDRFGLSEATVRSPHASKWARVDVLPGLTTHYALLPGLSMSPLVPPVVDLASHLTLTTTLGAGAMRGPGLAQQWGLPAHWFAVANTPARWNAAHARAGDSDALCVGLADLPEGDFWVRTAEKSVTAIVNVRSDLWDVYADHETLTVGAALLFFVGETLLEAPRAYYRYFAARNQTAGTAYPTRPQPRDVRRWTHFNTWGSEVAEALPPENLDQARLDTYFAGLEASGLRPSQFVIDDKWEGCYGVLTHDERRFPTFLPFLDKVRQRGYQVGLWAAFLRCEDPAAVGLSEDHLMKDRQGRVLWFQHQSARYGLYDISQPAVAEVLAQTARRFMEVYRPDLIKFDFGYELPTLDVACPADRQYRGERLLKRGLSVLLGAMKAVKPDLVVLYYGLSPLLAPYYDLHSLDDLVYAPNDYVLEGGRRIALASLLGEVGMPVASSTGYDWASAADLWLDAAACGVPTTLLPFGPDEWGEGPTDEKLALFRGISAVVRARSTFTARPVGAPARPSALSLTSRGWRREEDGSLVLVSLKEGGRVDEFVSNGPLVVADLDGTALLGSAHWGLVPAGRGDIAMPVARGSRWDVTIHRFRAAEEHSVRDAPEGVLDWAFGEGGPVEWLEFRLRQPVG